MSKGAKAIATRLFDSIDRSGLESTWFITCTLPRNFFCPIHEFKRILQRYFARLTRAFGTRLSWYWAIEPTEAGQWHVHMIAMWVRCSVPAPVSKSEWLKFRAWNDRAWHEATRVPDEAHLRAGCRVESARHWAGVKSYLSGYLSVDKWSSYDGPETGRVHGIRNGGILPINVETCPMSPRAVSLLRRAAARYRVRKASGVFCIWLREDGTVEQKKRQPGLERYSVEPDGTKARRTAKWLAEIALKAPTRMRVKRLRPRFFQNVRGCWSQEVTADRYGNERTGKMVFDERDAFGAESYAFGPSEIRMPWDQARRLIQWAVREDLRRIEAEDSLPF